MENDGLNTQFQSEQQLQNAYQRQLWKERIYRFFYNIWPSVNRVLSFFFYHIMRIIKGSIKIAMEQFHKS